MTGEFIKVVWNTPSGHIKIIRMRGGFFDFNMGMAGVKSSGRFCAFCDYWLKSTYVYLINELKEAGLLEKDYPLMCCMCFRKHKLLGFMKCPKCGGNIYSISENGYGCRVCGEIFTPKNVENNTVKISKHLNT